MRHSEYETGRLARNQAAGRSEERGILRSSGMGRALLRLRRRDGNLDLRETKNER
jgi:hypothetical protein